MNVEPGDATAVEIISIREATARKAEAEAYEAEQLAAIERKKRETAAALELIDDMKAETHAAISRLDKQGWPGGEIQMVICAYHERRTWRSLYRLYHVVQTEVIAAWMIDHRLGGTFFIGSTGKVYVRAMLGYRNHTGSPWGGIHDIDLLINESNGDPLKYFQAVEYLEQKIKIIKAIAT